MDCIICGIVYLIKKCKYIVKVILLYLCDLFYDKVIFDWLIWEIWGIGGDGGFV